jgi:two-component system sensor kinase
VILIALGISLIVYQRRFVAMHRTYSDGLLTAQEQERSWVAREVHDDALQRIRLLIQEVDDWESHGNGNGSAPDFADRAHALRAELEDLSASLRQMAYRLHPSFHTQEGLVPMLERLAREIGIGDTLRVEVRAVAPCAPTLCEEKSLAIYRIVQEALNNVMRHARSTWALVEVRHEEEVLDLIVEDYGQGFDQLRISRTGLGLTSMTERARSAGGILSVDSHPGGGTRVHLRLPTASPA